MSENGNLRGGIDLGGTKIEAIVVDAENQVLGQSREPTPTDGGPADVAKQMADAMTGAAKAAGIETATLHGIGVGSPGDVDDEAGTVANARNLPNWLEPFELAAALSERLGAAVHLGNDVQVATRAEFRLGAGKPYDSVLGVFWGTGVGGGIILNGEPWRGRGAAGEIGHTVVRRGGARCPCGRRGCLEAYAGRGAMEARARREVDKGAKTDLFKLMKNRGRTPPDQLDLGPGPPAGGRAGHRAHRPGGPRARRRDRLRGQPPRRRGRDHRRRSGRPFRAADGRADLHRDAPAPVQRLASARRPRGRARGPGRRDRRGFAGGLDRAPIALTNRPSAPVKGVIFRSA